MTIQRYSHIRKYLFIFPLIFLLSSCDIVDAIFGSGNDDSKLSSQQEQALTTVLSVQDDASDIMDNLFSLGLDTLTVIDSLYIFFSNDTSVQNAWADSEGVAVDYNNGISGGIFIGRYNPPIIEGSPPDTFIIELPDADLQKRLKNSVSYSPLIKKSIYFDGAYTQFKGYNDDVINTANNSFAKIGIAPFVKYLDHEATLNVLSTLSDYGIIHLTGHGWFKYSGSGLWADKVSYLLIGEVAQLNKTFGDLWTDILDKNIIVAKYGFTKENRYWVSPKFISDRNSFHDNEVFIYNGFCWGFRQPWRREMIINAGASSLVGIYYSVYPSWESGWAKKMYEKMCDTEFNQPETIRNCIRDIVAGERGYYSFDDWDKMQRFYIHLKRSSNRDYTFWEPKPPNEIEVDYFIDKANFKITYKDGTPPDYVNGAEHTVHFTSLPGTSSYIDSVYTTTFDNPPVLGQTIRGNMRIEILDNPLRVDVYINQEKSWSSFIVGNVKQYFTVAYNDIPYYNSYTEDGKLVVEYSVSGNSVSQGTISFKEDNDLYIDELTSYSCGDGAYFKVKIHYE